MIMSHLIISWIIQLKRISCHTPFRFPPQETLLVRLAVILVRLVLCQASPRQETLLFLANNWTLNRSYWLRSPNTTRHFIFNKGGRFWSCLFCFYTCQQTNYQMSRITSIKSLIGFGLDTRNIQSVAKNTLPKIHSARQLQQVGWNGSKRGEL